MQSQNRLLSVNLLFWYLHKNIHLLKHSVVSINLMLWNSSTCFMILALEHILNLTLSIVAFIYNVLQETTATVLTAALASKKSDPLASGAPNIASLQPGSSSSMDVPSSSINKDVESSEARPLVASEIIEENKSCEHPVKVTLTAAFSP